MSDKTSYSLKELATLTNSDYLGDPEFIVSGVSSLDLATSTDVSFLSNPRYAPELTSTQAGIVCIDKETKAPENKNFLVSEMPSKAFQIITDLLIPDMPTGFVNIHPTAVIHESAKVHPSAQIGPNTTIDQNVSIGKNTKISSNVSINAGTQVGDDCQIHSNVTIRERSLLHNRVILQPGCVIGSCGFGYITSKEGKHQKIRQLGIVILEDDVEIGSNTTIDRARFASTTIKQGTKIDNLVQIGHNVCLGKHNIVVAQTGIAGSTKTGDYVIIGAQVGITGHIEITSHCQIATKSGVSKSLKTSGAYGGVPAVPFNEFNAHRVHVKRLPKYAQKIKDLEKELEELKLSIKNLTTSH